MPVLAGRTFLSPQFLRYILVGLATVGVDIAGVYFLLALSVGYQVSITLGFALALAVNYSLHTYFTFEAPRMSWTQVRRYSVVVALNYVITMAIVWLAHEGLLLPVMVGKIASLPVMLVNGYYLCKIWVFFERS